MEYKYHIEDPLYRYRYLAEEALNRLMDIFDKCGVITMNDVYRVYTLTTGEIISRDRTDFNKYIHLNAREASVVRTGDGYIIYFKTPFLMDWEENRAKPDSKPDSKPDMVNHPKHYKSEAGLEVIDVIEAFTADLTGIQATDTGNIIKYICRWKSKNGVEDLEKAKWYLEHLISKVKNNSTKESN